MEKKKNLQISLRNKTDVNNENGLQVAKSYSNKELIKKCRYTVKKSRKAVNIATKNFNEDINNTRHSRKKDIEDTYKSRSSDIKKQKKILEGLLKSGAMKYEEYREKINNIYRDRTSSVLEASKDHRKEIKEQTNEHLSNIIAIHGAHNDMNKLNMEEFLNAKKRYSNQEHEEQVAKANTKKKIMENAAQAKKTMKLTDLEIQIAENKEDERKIESESNLENIKKKNIIERESLQKIEEEKTEERKKDRESKTYNGTGRGYDTGVTYQVEVRGDGRVDTNFRLIYYSGSKTRFRLELVFKDTGGNILHSWTTSDIELNNLEDTSISDKFEIAKNKTDKINSVDLVFRWAVIR